MADRSTAELAEAVARVKDTLMARATGEAADNAEYAQLRSLLLASPVLKGRLPDFLARCRSLDEFWRFIQPKIEGYKPRRAYLSEVFNPLLDDLEAGRLSGSAGVSLQADMASANPVSHEFIQAQVAKCDYKLASGDYDGAITNARALLEAVLREMELRLSATPPATDGNLVKQYQRVQRLLHLDAASQAAGTPLQQVLTGLASVVSGMSGLRNALSDAHVRTQRPSAHHARLAVNAAKTVADFVFETFEYQKGKGKLGTAPGVKEI